jgi:hypothetical protein
MGVYGNCYVSAYSCYSGYFCPTYDDILSSNRSQGQRAMTTEGGDAILVYYVKPIRKNLLQADYLAQPSLR